MLHPRVFERRAGLPLACGLLVAVLTGLALFASCDDPQSPPPAAGDPEFLGAYDSAGGKLEFRIETANGTVSPLRLVAGSLEFDAGAKLLYAQVAIRNAGSTTLPGPNAVLVDRFDPETVQPVNALPLRCEPTQRCIGAWEFIHHGTYGEDDLLSPGEMSTPIEWIFADSTGESFSFRALLRPEDATRDGIISGTVFADVNGDGQRQASEIGIADAAVSLLHEDSTTSTATDIDGHFEFQVSTAGLYEVVHETSDDCAPTTPSHRQVFIVRRPDGSLSGYSGIAFGCRAPGDSAIVVAGIVFEDMNRDGTYQVGEPGLADVLITGATPCPTLVPIQARTDEHGRYELRLPACPPPYVITRETLPGFVDTSPNPVIFPGLVPGPPIPVSPPPGTSVGVLHANFGVARADSSMESSVEGMVFEDVNRNGVYEDEDRGLPNVEVTAAGIFCMTPVIGVTRTDAMGRYVLRQSDVHCTLPWRVTHAALAGLCDTSPNPVDVGYDRRPDPRHYRVDFAVALCDSIPGDSRLVVFVHWQNQGLEGRRLEILDLGAVRFTNSAGLAEFALPAGDHILRAYVNVGGPAGFTDVSVTTRQGETTQVDVVDCLPCVAPR